MISEYYKEKFKKLGGSQAHIDTITDCYEDGKMLLYTSDNYFITCLYDDKPIITVRDSGNIDSSEFYVNDDNTNFISKKLCIYYFDKTLVVISPKGKSENKFKSNYATRRAYENIVDYIFYYDSYKNFLKRLIYDI